MRRRKKLKRKIKIFLVIIILFSLSLVLYNYKDKIIIKDNNKDITPLEEEKKVQPKELSLVMVGDCLIHGFVYKDAAKGDGTYDFSSMFSEISPLIKDYDLAYYNQESIIGGKKLGLSAYPRFNSPEEIGDDMLDIGFNLVSLANNHTMDKNEIGVINSVNYWKTKPGVYYTGQALSEEDRTNNIKVSEKNGISYAMLSYTTVTNGLLPPSGKEYLTNIYSEEKAKKDIELIKDKSDLIIVAMHWGVEYTTQENAEQRKIAEYLSSLGVNIIIGTHPHVIQPVEMVNDTLVFYSLGNFISAQISNDRLTGALASVNIKKDENNKILLENPTVELMYTYYKNSVPHNFKIYPYKKLNNSISNNYVSYYNKYKNVLTKYMDVKVVDLND